MAKTREEVRAVFQSATGHEVGPLTVARSDLVLAFGDSKAAELIGDAAKSSMVEVEVPVLRNALGLPTGTPVPAPTPTHRDDDED